MTTRCSTAQNTVTSKWSRGVVFFGGVTVLRYIVNFGTQVTLARLLLPEHFGGLALLLTFVTGFTTIATLSSDRFLVRRKVWSSRHYNVAFTAEFVMVTLAVIILFFVGPSVMSVLGRPELGRPLQVFSALLFLTPFNLPRSACQHNLDFGRLYLPSLVGVVAGSGSALVLAFSGYGVWSLVIGRVVGQSLEAATIWSTAPYRPRFSWDFDALKDLSRFGWPITGAGLLVFVYWHVDYVLVDRLLGKEALGYYFFAFHLTQHLLQLKVGLAQIAFPVLARQSRASLAGVLEKFTWLSACIYLLVAAVVVGLGNSLVRHVLGPSWIPAVVPLKILTVLTAWRGLTGYLEPVFTVLGAGRMIFRFALATCLILPVVTIPLTIWMGVGGAALGVTISVIGVGCWPILWLRARGIDLMAPLPGPLIAFLLSSLFLTFAERMFVTEHSLGRAAIVLVVGVAVFVVALVVADRRRVRAFLLCRRSWLDAPEPIQEPQEV